MPSIRVIILKISIVCFSQAPFIQFRFDRKTLTCIDNNLLLTCKRN